MRNTLVLTTVILTSCHLPALAVDGLFVGSGSFPDVSGTVVVWQTGDSGIKASDLSNNTTYSLNNSGRRPAISDWGAVSWLDGGYTCYQQYYSSNYSVFGEGNQTFPDISGNFVVWQDNRSGNSDIYGWLENPAPLCSAIGNQTYPAVSRYAVVWQDDRNGNLDIYGYDRWTGAEFPICVHPARQIAPDISENMIVWADDRNGNSDIFAYDMYTQTEFAVCTDNAVQTAPAICGSIVVWQDNRNGNFNIYGLDLSTGTEFVVCAGPAMQSLPAVSEQYIVWQDSRQGDWSIFAAPITSQLLAGNQACSEAIQASEEYTYQGAVWQDEDTIVSSCGFNDLYAVWYKYAPLAAGQILITTDNSTFDTVLSVYEGCGGAELACNDDYSFDNPWSQVVMNVVRGKTYYIRVAGFNGEVGDYDLLITRGACASQPQSDLTGDCRVNLEDFLIFASEWLTCGFADPTDC